MLVRHHNVLVAISRIRHSLRRLMQDHICIMVSEALPDTLFVRQASFRDFDNLYGGELRQHRPRGTSPISKSPLKLQLSLILEAICVR